MPFLLQPWHILLAALSAMVNQRQQHIIEFQNAQIEALLKQRRDSLGPSMFDSECHAWHSVQ